MAPNFFMEVKGPDGSAAVATRQARYDGAIGSRAMHSLQNYGKEEPVYDNNAYTFSSSYHDGYLKLYAHYRTAPTTEGARPEYHMTQLDTWGLTGNIDTFRRGTTALRNARDLAKRHRDRFIEDANTVARLANVPTSEVHPTVHEAHDNAASSSAVVDHQGYVPQDAQGELRWNQSIVESPSLPQYLDVDEDSPDASQASAAPDFVDPSTSFTLSLSTIQTSAKRSRQSNSPPSSSVDNYCAKIVVYKVT